MSVAANIVEGCAREPRANICNFVNIATGSAAETLYLLDLSGRLGFLKAEVYSAIRCESTVCLLAGVAKIATIVRSGTLDQPRAPAFSTATGGALRGRAGSKAKSLKPGA